MQATDRSVSVSTVAFAVESDRREIFPRNRDRDRCRKWAGSGRLPLKWLYLGVRSRSQGCRVTLTAGATPVEGRRGFRWRVETALALATFSCSRVREERGDGVKHSTTLDGQGVTTRPSNINPCFPRIEVPADRRPRSPSQHRESRRDKKHLGVVRPHLVRVRRVKRRSPTRVYLPVSWYSLDTPKLVRLIVLSFLLVGDLRSASVCTACKRVPRLCRSRVALL